MLSPVQFALSTSVCNAPAPAATLLQRWVALRADHPLGLATDARLPLPVQRELLADLAGGPGPPCRQLTHPMVQTNGRPVASPLSTDRDERLAASQALLETVQLAEARQVTQVLVYPWPLPLHLSALALARLFARGDAPPLAQLGDERRDRATAALDGLKLSLDPLATRADAHGVRIVLAAPAVWPHQLPDPEEIAELQREFAGAPLGMAHHTDWQHAASRLRGLPQDDLDTRRPVSAVGLADACGLRLNLPLGSGESAWQASLEDRQSALPQIVLTFDEHTSPAELDRALSLVNASTPGRS